ncbi:MFS general substrate transporter [Rhizoclosmatium globosum]|uniref:MFS general substrate transporter n=1 Tax=Rhizoclosmatium globosum TaxID=329046 RepID=A0A1Y2C9M5_9FUNG|nr:MFS general substrate transporter [Rhizoclosmatium globosum]|eukprot:ORY43738.1 MFS general substrate transporter [Rhizoclosmatium globosum]
MPPDLKKRALLVKRYITMASSCLCMAAAGSLFSFSVISGDIKKQLSYTASDLSLVSGIGNSSIYISCLLIGPLYDYIGANWTMLCGVILYSFGYALMYLAYIGKISGSAGWMAVYYFIVGMGSTCGYIAGIAINVKNFGATSYLGMVIGILLLFYGLSGTIYSQVYHGLFLGNTSGFLLFLAVSVAVVNMISTFTFFEAPVPVLVPEAIVVEERPSTETLTEVIRDMEVVEDVRDMSMQGSLQRRRCSNSTITSGADSFLKVTGRSAGGVGGTVRSRRATSQTEVSLSPVQILKTPIFWIFSCGYIFMQGLTYISNFLLILQAARGADASASDVAYQNATHMTIISVFQSLGRLFFAVGLDWLPPINQWKTDRSALFLVTQVLVLLPSIILACGATSDAWFYFSSICIGFGFGGGGACFPVLTKDYFGTKFYGTACGFVMAAVPLGVLLSNQVFGLFYDKKADSAGNCYSSECYSKAFGVLSGIECIALVACITLLV